MNEESLTKAEREVLHEVLTVAEIGYLGILTRDGYPRVVPLNFVAEDETVVFHGSGQGEKFDVLKESPRVTFSASIPYSTIPSYWMMEDVACPATIFFKSVQINGRGQVIEDLEEKAQGLQRFMEKYQPEGGHLPITTAEPIYEQLLMMAQTFRIVPERVTVRSKFAQNHPESTRRNLIARLEERNQGMDLQTAEELRKTL